MTRVTRRRVSTGIAVVTVAALAGALVLTPGDVATTTSDLPFIVSLILGMLGLSVVGVILVRQAPENPIGWLFQLTSLSYAIAIFGSEYAVRGATNLPGLAGPGYVGAFSQFVFPIAIAMVPMCFLLFPDGHLPSRRWRSAAWVLWAGAIVAALLGAFGYRDLDLDNGVQLRNPVGVLPEGFVQKLGLVAGAALVVGSVTALLSVAVRFRRSRGEERQQLRWLAWAAALILASILAVLVTGIIAESGGGSTANDIAFLCMVVSVTIGLPLATTVAILRYRLYDLDLVIKKTAIFSIVAVVLSALYLGLVALAALVGLGGVAAVILFVITFNPVRRRARKLADRIVYGKRATPFEVLSEFSERVGETYSIDDVLPRMTQLLAASTGAVEARTWLRVDARMRSAAVEPADAGATPDVALSGDAMPTFADGVSAFPVTHQGELLGAITLRMATNDPIDPSKERLALGVASQAGLALRNVQLVEDLRASRRRIVAAQDERAKKLERNIHDGAQQQLVALSVKLRLAEQLSARDPDQAASLLRELQVDATTALDDLRDLARGIYPPLLADQGLAVALEAQARKAAVPVSVEPDRIDRYDPEIEATVYFACLEALQNVAKYANASHATVRLTHAADRLTFEVADDGRGFDPATTPRGTGLQGVEDRLAAVGGEAQVSSSPGQGTTVGGSVPTGTGDLASLVQTS